MLCGWMPDLRLASHTESPAASRAARRAAAKGVGGVVCGRAIEPRDSYLLTRGQDKNFQDGSCLTTCALGPFQPSVLPREGGREDGLVPSWRTARTTQDGR